MTTTATITEGAHLLQATNNEPVKSPVTTTVQDVAKSRFDGIKAFFCNHRQQLALATTYVVVSAGLFTVMGPAAFGIGVLATAVIAAMCGAPS